MTIIIIIIIIKPPSSPAITCCQFRLMLPASAPQKEKTLCSLPHSLDRNEQKSTFNRTQIAHMIEVLKQAGFDCIFKLKCAFCWFLKMTKCIKNKKCNDSSDWQKTGSYFLLFCPILSAMITFYSPSKMLTSAKAAMIRQWIKTPG